MDNLPPREPDPLNPNPNRRRQSAPLEPAVPATDPPSPPPLDMAIEFLRLPNDDDERFLLKSGTAFSREKLAREIRLDAWDRHLESERQISRPRRSYWDRLSPQDRERLERELSSTPSQNYDQPLDATPEGKLALAIEKRLPPKTSVHEPLTYEIIIENRGREMLESVDVDEAVPPTHQLTGVSPAGYFENHLLRWRLKAVQPGEKRRLSVEVVPSEAGTIETTTTVRPTTTVGSLTQIEKASAPAARREAAAPPIRLRRSGYKTVSLDESIVFTNHVQNLMDSPQQDVKIVETVPAGFRVIEVEDQGIYNPEAGTITWELASLPPGETANLSVRLQAETPGELTSRVKGSTSAGRSRAHPRPRSSDSDSPPGRVPHRFAGSIPIAIAAPRAGVAAVPNAAAHDTPPRIAYAANAKFSSSKKHNKPNAELTSGVSES